ncbi:MAG: RidA family protein [Pseudomonadota bacterium]
MNTIESRLADIGLTLPEAAAPVASYVSYIIAGGLVYVSGQLPFKDGGVVTGLLGENMDVEAGNAAAQICALGLLAQVKAACEGDLDQVDRCIKLGGFVASTPQFKDHPKVVNGASDLMITALGDAGRHARAAVGVSSLPLGAAVEVDGIFSLK